MAASTGRPFPAPPRILAWGLAFLACTGMSCEPGRDPPGLPSAVLTEIRLGLADPARGAPGVSLAWRYSGERVAYYEVLQSLSLDSLLAGAAGPPVPTESTGIRLELPGAALPCTVYYAVRAIWVEPTGQKSFSDTLVPDSLIVKPALEVLRPAAGSALEGRVLDAQVHVDSDPGMALRMAYYEKEGPAWRLKLDTCLPMEACGRPVFGISQQGQSLVLEQREAGDTLNALFCAYGDESFDGRRTGSAQSLACSRFLRVGP